MSERRGAAAGDQSVEWLKDLIARHEAEGTTLPTRGDALNHVEILKRIGPTGVGRHVIQDNREFEHTLRAYAAGKGLRYSIKEIRDADEHPLEDDQEKSELRRRLREFETRNAELVAQVVDLKIRLREAENHEAEIITSGKRYDLGFLGVDDA